MHTEDVVDLYASVSQISARKKTGRPADRLPALQRAQTTGKLDMTALCPEKWLNLPIYRDNALEGIIKFSFLLTEYTLERACSYLLFT
jgi:hypothetical protein